MNDLKVNSVNKNSYCLIFHNYSIMVKGEEGQKQFLLIDEVEQLGIDVSNKIFIGELGSEDYFVVSVTSTDNTEGLVSKSLAEIGEEVSQDMAAILLRALSISSWYSSNTFCSCCAGKMALESSEIVLKCTNCNKLVYPKVTPAVLVTVLKGDKVLLARSPHFSPNLFSAISGFVEAGEPLESAVRREVKEEVGIEIKNIRYFGSFPTGADLLMLAFIAEHASGDIEIDNNEIEAADWFSLDNLPLTPNNKMSIARIMINHLVDEHRKNTQSNN